MKYNSVLDLHTHTIVSGHAYCTLREMAKGIPTQPPLHRIPPVFCTPAWWMEKSILSKREKIISR